MQTLGTYTSKKSGFWQKNVYLIIISHQTHYLQYITFVFSVDVK